MKIKFLTPVEIGFWYPLYKLPHKYQRFNVGDVIEVRSWGNDTDETICISHLDYTFSWGLPRNIFEIINENINVEKAVVNKVIVTISLRQLWDNYLAHWNALVWKGQQLAESYQENLKTVATALLHKYPVRNLFAPRAINNLFKQGSYTKILLGEQVTKELKFQDKTIIREIHIVDEDGVKFATVDHSNIRI